MAAMLHSDSPTMATWPETLQKIRYLTERGYA
jgi:hypothetical protein